MDIFIITVRFLFYRCEVLIGKGSIAVAASPGSFASPRLF